MATGDRFGLADKQTLDIVKSTADSIKLDTYNLTQKLAETADDIKSSNNIKDYITANDIVNSKYRAGLVTVNTNTTVLLEVEGSGLIYGILYLCSNYTASGTGTDTISLNVDGVNGVYASSFNHLYTELYGLMTPEIMSLKTYSNNGTQLVLPGDSATAFNNRAIGINPRSAGNSIIYLPKPLRFEEGFSIRGTVSTANNITNYGKLYYLYILD